MTESQTKVCQNCKKNFVIEPDDFAFYEKIKVPPPTWCPECRLQRRLSWRNLRSLYKRKCGYTGERIISIYSPDKPYLIYEQNIWNSDKWDPLKYGVKLDFSKLFLEGFKELQLRVPLPNLNLTNVVNSDYCGNSGSLKNCYLVFNAFEVENSQYSEQIYHSKDCMDCDRITKSELCYNSLNCENCYRSSFLQDCYNCINSILCYDCRGCSNCFGCTSLRNKQYYIFNQPYSKEDYAEKLRELDISSLKSLKNSESIYKNLKLKTVRKFVNLVKSTDCTGDLIFESKNCKNCFDILKCENLKNVTFIDENAKDCIDVSFAIGQELSCDAMSVAFGYQSNFSSVAWYSSNIQYSYNCRDSNNLFACIGLRNKQYCILNKQYTKEEYEKLVPQIIEHMNKQPYVDQKGRIYKYGEFFPPELSPFAYNETIAQEYFPLTKEQAISQGYRWKDPDLRNYSITKLPNDLPDHIRDVPDSITNEVVGCAHEGKCNHQCTTAFKVIPEELQFYRRMNLPLPRLCPNCRHYERLKQRNPLKLWHRTCQCAGEGSENGVYKNTIRHSHGDDHCPNEFETSYNPERKEIIYCESCYNVEVV